MEHEVSESVLSILIKAVYLMRFLDLPLFTDTRVWPRRIDKTEEGRQSNSQFGNKWVQTYSESSWSGFLSNIINNTGRRTQCTEGQWGNICRNFKSFIFLSPQHMSTMKCVWSGRWSGWAVWPSPRTNRILGRHFSSSRSSPRNSVHWWRLW